MAAKGKQRTAGGKRRKRREFEWESWPLEDLLDLRLCELHLTIEGSEVADRITQLYEELDRKGIRFRPHVWLSSDWFSPVGVPGIAIPFYLAHPRLKKLEYRMMYEVEGGTRTWCMQLLRHETGHAIDTAYRLNRRASWRRLFGKASKPYPKYYNPKPFSRNYVLHLDWWYAQSHPTEDFAETFAVWLKPGSNWRKRYESWPALRKLLYVDALMKEIAEKPPVVKNRVRYRPLSQCRQTLRDYYRRKQARYGSDLPAFFDRDLVRLFSEQTDRRMPTAAAFLRRHRTALRDAVARWTGQHAYTVDQLLKEMIIRARELKLRVDRPVEQVKLETALLLATQLTHFVRSRDHRVAL